MVVTALMIFHGNDEQPDLAMPAAKTEHTGNSSKPGKWKLQGAERSEDEVVASAESHPSRGASTKRAQAATGLNGARPDVETTTKVSRSDDSKDNTASRSLEEFDASRLDRSSRVPQEARERSQFDYSRIQSLWVLRGDSGYLYSRFPVFLEYRAMIVEKLTNAERSDVDFTKMIYEVRAVGIGEETRIFVGDSWIDDGEVSAELSEEELDWLRWAYESRTGNAPRSRQEIERAVQGELREQRDPAWRPDP